MERPPDPHDLLAHAGFLKALAFGLLRDEQRAEDVVQESFAAFEALARALRPPPPGRRKKGERGTFEVAAGGGAKVRLEAP